MPVRLNENTNSRSYAGQPGTIDYALNGNTSFYARPGGLQIFVGSPTAAATYVAAPNSVIGILDPGASRADHALIAYGLKYFSPTSSRAYVIDNRHLYLYDIGTKEGVVLFDWMSSQNAVSIAFFSDVPEIASSLRAAVRDPAVAPRLTWEQSGLGMSTTDANEAIAFYTARAKALAIEAPGFNAAYYTATNPDVAAAGVDPLAHYDGSGWKEGRNPNAFFNSAVYLAKNPDVAAAGIDPLMHYEMTGWREGRDAGTGVAGGFDTLKYLALNADVAAAGVNPLDHYIGSGVKEGRRIA